MKDVRVNFDGEPIEMGTSEEIVMAEWDEAKYVLALDSEGAHFLVYIPHFSEHTIEIESLSEMAKENIITNSNYIAIGLAVLVFAGLLAFVFKKGRG